MGAGPDQYQRQAQSFPVAKLAFEESEVDSRNGQNASNLSYQPTQLLSLLDQNLADQAAAQLGSYAYLVRVQSNPKLSDHSCILSGSAAELLGSSPAQTVMLYSGSRTAESWARPSCATPDAQQAKQRCIYIRMLSDNSTGMHQSGALQPCT